MRRKDREIKDTERIREILDKGRIMHLGLFDQPYPYVVPVHYGYQFDENGLILYFHGADEGHKLDLLRRDGHVCAQIDCEVEDISGGDVPCRYGSTYASLIRYGHGEILEENEEKIKAMKCLMYNQAHREFEFSEEMLKHVCLVRIRVDSYTRKEKRNPAV